MPEPSVDCVLITVNGKFAFTQQHYNAVAEFLDDNTKYCYRIREALQNNVDTDRTHYHSQEWLRTPVKPSNLTRGLKTMLTKKFPESYPSDNAFKSWVQVKASYSFMKEYFTKAPETTEIMRKNLPERSWIDQYFEKFKKPEKVVKMTSFMQKLKKLWDADKGPADSKSRDAIIAWMNKKFNQELIPYPKDGRTAMWLIHKFYCYLNDEDFVTPGMVERWDMTCN